MLSAYALLCRRRAFLGAASVDLLKLHRWNGRRVRHRVRVRVRAKARVMGDG